MKKVVLLDFTFIALSFVLFITSMVLNISAFGYVYSTKSYLNLILIFRFVSFILLVLFIVLTFYIILIKKGMIFNSQKIQNIFVISITVIALAASVVFSVVTQLNYKSYGDDIIKELQNDKNITCINETTEIESKGVAIYKTKILTLFAQNYEGADYHIDCLRTNKKLLIKQYLIQQKAMMSFEVFNNDNPQVIKYKDVYIKKWSSSASTSENTNNEKEAYDSTETNIYTIQSDNCVFYFQSTSDTEYESDSNDDSEIKNLYLIYKQTLKL